MAKADVLTKDRVIALTAPAGMSKRTWTEYLKEALSAQTHPGWADPWERGSPEWETFIGEAQPKTPISGTGVAVDRATFRRLVATHLSAGRPGHVSARALALAMASHAHVDGSQSFPSAGVLAGKLGNSRQRVNTARLRLVSDGWLIATDERQGRANVYQLSVPAHLVTCHSEVQLAA